MRARVAPLYRVAEHTVKILGMMSPKSTVEEVEPERTVRVSARPFPDEPTTLQPMQDAAGLLLPLLSGQELAVIRSGANHAYREPMERMSLMKVPAGHFWQSVSSSCRDTDVAASPKKRPTGHITQDDAAVVVL
jgi:hypothetical protein